MSTSLALTSGLRRKQGKGERGFRPDIEGLRAVAVLSVLVYHLRSGWLPGGYIGVDIFFVISGFLITSHLVREHDSTGTISLTRFYARRMVRLIPAATLVLVATAAATFLVVPRILWQQVGSDIAASAVYVINWVLAFRSVDYLAEDSIVSPVQHFWSLAVEEQFYIVWPLLILLLGLLAVKLRLPKRRVLVAAGSAVIVLSLAAAVVSEQAGDVTAYFATTTRLWELAAGGVAALLYAAFHRRVAAGVRGLVFWAGLAGVLGSIVLIGDQTTWPGIWTVLPIAATALLLLSGGAVTGRSLGERILGTRPLVWVGGISYSLYLWHWPIIVLAGYVLADVGLLDLAVIAVLSVLLAWASNRLVENPIRFSRWARARSRNGLLLGLVSGAVSVVAGVALVLGSPASALTAPDGAVPKGAAVLSSPLVSTPAGAVEASPAWVLPNPIDAPDDVPDLYADGCQQTQQSDEALQCVYGEEGGTTTVAIVGDSKAAQWLPAFEAIAAERDLKLVVMTKSSCAFSEAPSVLDNQRYESCDRWNDNVMSALEKLRPELVMTSTVQESAWTPDLTSSASADGADSAAEGTPESRALMADGIAESISQVRSLGSEVVMLADTPQPPSPVYECVAEHPDDVAQCAFDYADGVAHSAEPTQAAAAAQLGATVVDGLDPVSAGTDPGVALLDLNDFICPPTAEGDCPPIIGNALVWRQGSHVTATYVATLAGDLEAELVEAGVLTLSR